MNDTLPLLHKKQADYLHQHLNVTVISLFLALSLTLYIFWDLQQTREPFIRWYLTNLFILSLRVLCGLYYKKISSRPDVIAKDKSLKWIYYYISGASISGVTISLLIFIVPPAEDYYISGLLLLGTILIASITSLGAVRRAFFSYLAAMSIPVILFYFNHFELSLSFYFFAYLIIVLFSSHAVIRFNKNLIAAFIMEIDNQSLKTQLLKESEQRTQAQKELVNKAEELQSLNENLESKVQEKTNELKTLAFYDTLTQLPNRHHFYSYLERTLARNKITREPFAVLFVDLDEFKNINDTLGHDFGDTLLIEAAVRLRESTRVDDFIARISGDEFIIVLKGVPSTGELASVANNIIKAVSRPYSFYDSQTYISCSIGIALYPQDGENTQTLLKYSDLAMYYAKENGKNCFHFYNSKLYEQKAKKFILATELKTAIEKNELHLVYQPKVNTQSGKVSGMEVLLRWHSNKFGPVPVQKFISLSEESNLILELENFVINAALTQVKFWNDQTEQTFRVAINISGIHFKQKDFVQQIESILSQLDVDSDILELELTESTIMHNTQESIDKLSYLKSLGIRLSIDDFGTGYSSMSYLKQLPIDALKIDKSFIDGIPVDSDNKAITRAIIELAHQFKLETVAEGVEYDSQYQYLKQVGCQSIQGYFFYKPLSAEDFEKEFQLISKPRSN